ncbi:Islet cell autoantigen 1 69kDa [Caligus rogercresseyi]|uniref:Islet cell autoantigen 1 69kDa n=1 Tax=Caligus rogercresseyi TaxID=217165 RepID=A0A7T8H2V1_CALRO|nr:Islet cell autoantigen 1 69kDa [Caligus rogercresseyi]
MEAVRAPQGSGDLLGDMGAAKAASPSGGYLPSQLFEIDQTMRGKKGNLQLHSWNSLKKSTVDIYNLKKAVSNR